jgi:hypothetical protein
MMIPAAYWRCDKLLRYSLDYLPKIMTGDRSTQPCASKLGTPCCVVRIPRMHKFLWSYKVRQLARGPGSPLPRISHRRYFSACSTLTLQPQYGAFSVKAPRLGLCRPGSRLDSGPFGWNALSLQESTSPLCPDKEASYTLHRRSFLARFWPYSAYVQCLEYRISLRGGKHIFIYGSLMRHY